MSIIATKPFMPKDNLKRIKVPISNEYAQWTDEVAEGRIRRARDEKRKLMHGQKWEDKPENMRVGCRAEGAVAQNYGLEYNPGPDPDHSDVGGAEVRGTPYYTGKLIGHDGYEERTKQDMIFIFCVADLERDFVWMVGWCYGYELFRPELWADHWNNKRDCFAKPQHELKDLDRLVCIDEIIQER